MPEKYIKRPVCKTHKPKRKAKTPSVENMHKKRYSWRWQKLSKQIRLNYPLCMHPDCDQLTDELHHIKRGEAYPQLFFMEINLITLCNYHHDQVSGLERRGDYEAAEELYAFWPDFIRSQYPGGTTT